MSRSALFGNAFLATVAAACIPIFLASCLTIYPSIKYVSGVNVGEPTEQIRCFRAEFTRNKREYFMSSSDEALLLCEIPVSPIGDVKGQVRLTIDSRYRMLIGGAGTVRHTVGLRLYRPGYETVRLGPKDEIEVVVWKQVNDLAGQEQAVDDLLHLDYRPSCFPGVDKPHIPSIEHFLPGSASVDHRKALLYAASEYERLAGAAPDEQRQRLLDKATQVRDRAADDGSISKPPATPP